MNDLERYFRANTDKQIHKWLHYFEAYDAHFSRFRGREVHLLEIGVFQGGSLQMWKHYFGPQAKIYGVDIHPECASLEEENVKIFIGSQSDRHFLRKLKTEIPKIDILIDDGGHTMRQQIVTFEELYDHVDEHGVYLCEDTHTSYWLKYGGGHRRRGTFMEYSKNLVDRLNAFHSEQGSLKPDAFSRSVRSIHFYDSIVVFEKKPHGAPVHEKTGQASIDRQPVQSAGVRFRKRVTRNVIGGINQMLRALRLPGFIWR
ncbi:class I SAM-dependent methyltransferase [bacterium]|nr:class I SAM-dependent methyltransferase [bacterium]